MWKPSCVGCRLVSTVATAPLRLIASRCPSLYLFMSTNHLNWARYMSQAHFPIDQLAPHCHLPRYAVSAVRSCRSFWRSSFYSHFVSPAIPCIALSIGQSGILPQHSTAHQQQLVPSSKSLSAADTCSSVSSCFRANLSMRSDCHLAKSSSCSLCLSIFLQQGSHLLFQPPFCSGSHSVSIPLLTPICTVLGIPNTGTQQTCTGSKQLQLAVCSDSD